MGNGSTTYKVHPVGVFQHTRQVEPAHIPIRRGRRKSDTEIPSRIVKRVPELFEHLHVVVGIFLLPSAIASPRVFPCEELAEAVS